MTSQIEQQLRKKNALRSVSNFGEPRRGFEMFGAALAIHVFRISPVRAYFSRFSFVSRQNQRRPQYSKSVNRAKTSKQTNQQKTRIELIVLFAQLPVLHSRNYTSPVKYLALIIIRYLNHNQNKGFVS